MADVEVSFAGQLDHLKAQLASLEGHVKDIGGKTGTSLGAGIAGGLAAGATVIVAKLAEIGIRAGIEMGKAVATGLKDAVFAAADAQETMSRFRSLFGENAAAAEDWADRLGSSVGRSATEIKKGLSDFQAFFVGLGFGGDKAAEFAKKLEEASIDFASFNNLSDEESQSRFISALSGSSEVLDKFGVNLREAALATKGITKDSTEAEKAVARLGIIMDVMGSQGAIGDATKTANSFNNQWKAINATISQAYVDVGAKLLPVLEEMGPAIRHIIMELADLAKVAVDSGLAFTDAFAGDAANNWAETLIAVFARVKNALQRSLAEFKEFWYQFRAEQETVFANLSLNPGVNYDKNVVPLQQKAVAAFNEKASLPSGDAAVEAALGEFRAVQQDRADAKKFQDFIKNNPLPQAPAAAAGGGGGFGMLGALGFALPALVEKLGDLELPQFAEAEGKRPFQASFESLDGLFKRIQSASASGNDPVADNAKKTAENTKTLAKWVQDGAKVGLNLVLGGGA